MIVVFEVLKLKKCIANIAENMGSSTFMSFSVRVKVRPRNQ